MADAITAASAHELRPPGSRRLVHWSELLIALARKDLKIRYKRSVLGFLWSILNPVLLTGIYLFVFIYVYKVKQPDFVLFLLSGLLPWQFFNMTILEAPNAMVNNAPLIRKFAFPKILIPLATVLANVTNFILILGLFSVILTLLGKPVWQHFHWIILAIIIETILAVGCSLILAIGNVYLRDVRHIISFLTMVAFFATPIVYPLSRVPKRFLPIILANPMASIIGLYRAGFYDSKPPDSLVLGLGLLETLAILGLGLLVFKRFAPTLAKEV